MSDIIKRLRKSRWIDASGKYTTDYNMLGIEAERLDAADEIERLRAALESCEAWIDRWTQHVGACKGGDQCTCGRTAILYEAHGALDHQQQGDGK